MIPWWMPAVTPWWVPAAALAVDAAVGDPRWLPHPVVLMGRVVRWLEPVLRRSGLPLRFGGVVLALVLTAGSWAATWGVVRLAALVHPWLGLAVEVWLLGTCLAARSLAEHALAVWRALAAGDLAQARLKLSWIVGRDTARLELAEITRGAVETVAESTCDGVIAPLFWGFVGGAPLAMAYKAANTLDSLVGHKDERYLKFGWASARLDDLVNLVPARLSALLLALAALAGPAGSGRAGSGWPASGWAGSVRALGIALRDASAHPSPNSGWPEAAMAGALGVQLGGINYYDGVPEARAHMGDPVRVLEPQDIRRAVRLMYLATLAAAAAGSYILWGVGT